MKNLLILATVVIIFACKKSTGDQNVIVSHLENKISDSVFISTLENYSMLNSKIHSGRFIQIFVNYEQNISRYIYFTTKSGDDLYKHLPYDYFYYKDYLVLIYTGLEHIFKTKHSLPGDLNEFVNEDELFFDKKSEKKINVPIGANIWELKIYHSYNDSAVLNKNYEGVFVWNGSKIKFDTIVPFVRPIIHSDTE